MAILRARAFLRVSEGPRVHVCGVASRSITRARAFAADLDCDFATDDFRKLELASPEALLVEVPHSVQEEVVLWGLSRGFHALIGGCLARTVRTGRAIAEAAAQRGLIVEAGYEARYKEVWRHVASVIRSGTIGKPLLVTTLALFDQDRRSWYYDEELSGGMLVTHMSYAFINPVRFVFGMPDVVGAVSNRAGFPAPGAVAHETCVASLRLPGDIACSMVAGYVNPGRAPAWDVRVVGTGGSMDVQPGNFSGGRATIHLRGREPSLSVFEDNSAFEEQAACFVRALCTGDTASLLNPPEDAIHDVAVCAAIAAEASRR